VYSFHAAIRKSALCHRLETFYSAAFSPPAEEMEVSHVVFAKARAASGT
jgi:hypothetical protein